MDKKEFLFKVEKLIYKEIAKGINQLYGLNKTAPLSAGLFLRVPIQFKLEKTYEPRDYEVNSDSLSKCFSAYTMIGNSVDVFITFLYHEENDLATLFDIVEKYKTFWALIYQHELFHLLFKHTVESQHKRMRHIVTTELGFSESTAHITINKAQDYFINYCIKDLDSNREDLDLFLDIGLYEKDYHNRKLSDIDILREFEKEDSCNSIAPGLLEVTSDGTTSIQPEHRTVGANGLDSDTADELVNDIAQGVYETIQSNAKGSKSATMLAEMFEAIEVPVGWFKKLKAKLTKDVYYMTNDYYTKWSSLKNAYRRHFKAPKRYFIDKKLDIILSVDQSGSVSTEELQKLLYIIKSQGKKIASLTVLIHDTQIIKTYTLKAVRDIQKDAQFKEALATRVVVGGTSHTCIFDWLQTNVKDPSKTIYICYSDMDSDIEKTYTGYSILKRLPIYWVETQGKVLNPLVRGTHIYI